MCNQFFEGNMGNAELLNSMGRKEKNSFVDIVQSGPKRVWVRWSYLAVNMSDDSQPRLRGTEDYIAYCNGLVWRRMTYESLMPNEMIGYATDPVELFGVVPVGSTIKDLFPRDAEHGDYLTHTVLDLYSNKRYDIYWDERARSAAAATTDDGGHHGVAGLCLGPAFPRQVALCRAGRSQRFPSRKNQLIDHCTLGAEGGCAWQQGLWDHWPIGWLNSQTSFWKPGSSYAYSFGSVGQFFVPEGKRIKSFSKDYPELCKDMAFNRWTASRVSYVLLGAAADVGRRPPHRPQLARQGKAVLPSRRASRS